MRRSARLAPRPRERDGAGRGRFARLLRLARSSSTGRLEVLHRHLRCLAHVLSSSLSRQPRPGPLAAERAAGGCSDGPRGRRGAGDGVRSTGCSLHRQGAPTISQSSLISYRLLDTLPHQLHISESSLPDFDVGPKTV